MAIDADPADKNNNDCAETEAARGSGPADDFRPSERAFLDEVSASGTHADDTGPLVNIGTVEPSRRLRRLRH